MNLKADDWFFILSNRHRRQILRLCSIRPCYAKEIAEKLGISRSLVSKHLQELEDRHMVVKREETREEGGRNIQYFYVPFHPQFNFSIANEDLVDIDIIDESDSNVPQTHSRSKIIDTESISSAELQSIQEKLVDFLNLEEERIEVAQKLRLLRKKQIMFFKSMDQNTSQQQILLKIVRFLLDRYGFDTPFSKKELTDELGIDEESSDEILEMLSTDLHIIAKINDETNASGTMWKINKPQQEQKKHLDYS